jgi:hypothetical protein
MMDVQKINIELDGRLETGPIKIGDDWTGIHIRGDDALATAMYLREGLRNSEVSDPILENMILSHIKLLESCVEGENFYEDSI